eukprot:6283526-Heterocapsa_arctica.AAC.1
MAEDTHSTDALSPERAMARGDDIHSTGPSAPVMAETTTTTTQLAMCNDEGFPWPTGQGGRTDQQLMMCNDEGFPWPTGQGGRTGHLADASAGLLISFATAN